MGRPLIRDDLTLVEGYHSPQLDVRVRLNTNEAPVPPPPEFIETFLTVARGVSWNRYPERSAAPLRARIAEVESDGSPWSFTAANVLAANGSNEVLQSLVLTYAGAGRSVLCFEPTYALHAHISRVCGSAVNEFDRRDDFTLDVDAAVETISRSRPSVVFLCSPNNPTGREEEPPTVEALLAATEAVGGLLIVDEAYGQFAGFSALSLVAEDRNVVVTRTFSKTWSAAALRLGYLIGPTWAVSAVEQVVLPYHLDALTQLAGTVALDFDGAMRDRVAALVSERERLVAALAEIGVTQWPSGANFVLFRPPDGDGDAVWQGLVDRSVLVRNCSSWPRLSGCLRVTVGTPEENDAFLGALSEVLGSSTDR
ncbi:MAG: histidinol-phosphate transaminase [Actinobacteria bacterium]|nr:histidinol-phosphate transaminase [Actinomycetota bacterium]